MPQADADGNERSGICLPEILVPLATYASWNLRDPAIGAPDQRVAFEDSYLAFPKSNVEQAQTHDPRRSIAERYPSRDDYLLRYDKALDELVAQHWILPDDRAALVLRGEQEWAEATK